MKHQILEHVRKVCGLKKLEFGSVVEVLIPEYGTPSDGIEYSPAIVGYATYIECGEPMSFLNGNHIYDVYASDFKNGATEYVDEEDGITCTIIGLPVHLEHLLFALDKVSNVDWFETIASNGWFHMRTDRVFYDLSKSVEQNLEDPQVCEVISKLLKLK